MCTLPGMNIPGYTLTRKLAQGGMAAVYLARQASSGRDVALKVMVPQLALEPNFVQRFEREARLLARIGHPNIVAILDVGVVEQVQFIAMEYLDGGNLAERMAKGISHAEALRVVYEMADALNYAQSVGVVHRDIKPDNVMFRAGDPAAILTDFGVAKSLLGDTHLTQTGATVGTPKYMSPEQARGQLQDGRGDLYSLGVMLFEMLTGAVPFMADDPVALAMMHCKDPIPRLPAGLERYQDLIDNLLAKAPIDRFATGAKVMAAIDALTAVQEPIAVNPPPETRKPPSRPERYFRSGETPTGRWLTRRYALEVQFSADDFDEFRRHYDQLETLLHDWHTQRGKRARTLTLRIEAHPWIQARVIEVLRKAIEQNSALSAQIARSGVQVTVFDPHLPEGQHIELVAAAAAP